MFHQNGVMGVLEQGNFAYGGGASMDDLKSYLIAILLTQPQTDVDHEIHRFAEAVYGPGAGQYMETYIRTIEEAERSSALSIYQYPDADYITEELIVKSEKLFEMALANAVSDDYRHHIEREYLAVRYLRLTRLPMDTPNRAELVQEFFTDIKRHGLTEIMERISLDDSQRAVTNSMYAKDRQGFHCLYYIMQ